MFKLGFDLGLLLDNHDLSSLMLCIFLSQEPRLDVFLFTPSSRENTRRCFEVLTQVDYLVGDFPKDKSMQ